MFRASARLLGRRLCHTSASCSSKDADGSKQRRAIESAAAVGEHAAQRCLRSAATLPLHLHLMLRCAAACGTAPRRRPGGHVAGSPSGVRVQRQLQSPQSDVRQLRRRLRCTSAAPSVERPQREGRQRGGARRRSGSGCGCARCGVRGGKRAPPTRAARRWCSRARRSASAPASEAGPLSSFKRRLTRAVGSAVPW